MDATTQTHEEVEPMPTDSRITRPATGRMFAGVAAAFADRTGIDVSIVRITFVVTTFFGGFGIIAYLAGWLLLPNEGEDRSTAERWFGSKG